MPSNAMIQASDSQNPVYTVDDRPPLSITTKGRLVLLPPIEELLSRRGAKGLQTCLIELTHHHFMKHGYDWIYANGTVKTHGKLYFVHFDGVMTRADVHYLGNYRDALAYLMNYARTAQQNNAMRRAR